MNSHRNLWAVVLAAGSGSRLATLTTDACGNPVPKQFCSLNGGRSLLGDALVRAQRIVPRDRTCIIVAQQHRRFWRRALWSWPARNVVVQPSNRGTANGVLLTVLSILERDPFAQIIFLPADHYVRDEPALASSLRAMTRLLGSHTEGLVLCGIEPDEPDPELGYIVPGPSDSCGSHAVERFVEKPHQRLACELIAQGALWNSFIFAASGTALLGLLRERMAASVEDMETALARPHPVKALEELYERLPEMDFSRAIMQGAEHLLRVVAAAACGWSDLGTPKRVAETLRRLNRDVSGRAHDPTPGLFPGPAFINLAAQHARLGLSIRGSTP
ncbi:MAG TPA: sugar phosphate nucleotidyltransferase [Steroidobacteraceae bacterium]|nr:sugar phosphate nucleotidyltransferase [Steroidobacteraceae bacterium]